jgi:hypothetical protein
MKEGIRVTLDYPLLLNDFPFFNRGTSVALDNRNRQRSGDLKKQEMKNKWNYDHTTTARLAQLMLM